MHMAARGWRTLLVVAIACVLLKNGFIGKLAHSIEVGSLSSKVEDASYVVAKLSNGLQQQAWWQLASARGHWHDSAIHRFFAVGPLQAAEMERLAKVNGRRNSWQASGIVDVPGGQRDKLRVLLALQKLATATYEMEGQKVGTGKIKASMWTLLFRCAAHGSACEEGYLVPMVTIPKQDVDEVEQDHTQHVNQPEADAYYVNQYSYGTLWLNLTTNLHVNAIPSLAHEQLPASTPRTIPVQDLSQPLSIVLNVHDTVSRCGKTTFVGVRALLDASYGLIPGSACVKFITEHADTFNFLILRGTDMDDAATMPPNHYTALQDLIADSLHVSKSDQWKRLPFEECSKAILMVLSVSKEPLNYLSVCAHRFCINSTARATPARTGSTCIGVEYLRFLHSVASLSPSCTYNQGKALPAEDVAFMISGPATVSCPILSPSNNVCNETLFFHPLPKEYLSFFTFTPHSNWSYTEGLQTSEFSQAPHFTDSPNHSARVCIQKMSSNLFPSTNQAAFLDAIQIKAINRLQSFIAEHNVAFTTSKGPATDIASFLALIVSTAISVILAMPGPFTKFLLREICRRWPLYLDSHYCSSKVWNEGKVLFQTVCMVLLSLCSFLPVLYVAYSELDRKKPFSTWDLGSSDETIDNAKDFHVPELQVRVVYLLSATSSYDTHFIMASALVVCGSCFLVGVCSARHCKGVFERYTLLQKLDFRLAGNGPSAISRDITEDRDTLFGRALRAIYMTEVEYLAVRTELGRRAREAMNTHSLQDTEIAPTGTADESDPDFYRAAQTVRLTPYTSPCASRLIVAK